MASEARRIGLMTLAVVQMVFLIVAVGSVGFFLGKFNDDILKPAGLGVYNDVGLFGREEFFLFVACLGIIVAVFSLVVSIAGAQDKIHCACTMAAVYTLCCLALLVSSSLLAKAEMTYDSKKLCKYLDTTNPTFETDARCYQLIMGVVSGFLSLALFIASSVIYFASFCRYGGISFNNMDSIPA